MKALVFALCLALFACEEKKEVHQAPPPPPPPCPVVIPTSTNPFEKPPPAPPVPVREAFQPPRWEQSGEFKMNANWSIWTWRDAANHNTCYIYNVMPDGKFGMSCVKE